MSERVAYVAGLVGLYAVGVIVAALALYGCGTEPDQIYAQAFGTQCNATESATTEKLCRNRPAGHGVEHVSRYCYRTIGDANCFDQPDHDRKNQALGSSGY